MPLTLPDEYTLYFLTVELAQAAWVYALLGLAFLSCYYITQRSSR